MLPIHHIYRLWDHLLVSKPEMTLFIAFSILYQTREQILSKDFNQNMLWISSLSFVNIEKCILDSIIFSNITPPSLYDLNDSENEKSVNLVYNLNRNF